MAIALAMGGAGLVVAPASVQAQPAAVVRGLPDFTELVEQVGPSVVNIRTTEKVTARPSIGGMDEDMLEQVKRTAKKVVVMEEGVDCLGLRVSAALSPIPVIRMCVPNDPVSQACVNHQRQFCGLTADALIENLTEEPA